MTETTAQQDKKRGWTLVWIGLAIIVGTFVVAALLGNPMGIDGGLSADKAGKSSWTNIGDVTKLVAATAGLLTALTGLLKVIRGFRKAK